VSQNFDSLWTPEEIGSRIIALKHESGGYLSISNEGVVKCNSKTKCSEESNFYVIFSSKLCPKDRPNFIALRAFNGKYLSINEGNVSSSDDIYSEDELFSGYAFEQSNCI
jgi:hypothetical protein